MLRRPTHRATTASASFSSAAGAPNLAILPSAAGTSNAIGAPRLVPSAAGALKLVPSAAGALKLVPSAAGAPNLTIWIGAATRIFVGSNKAGDRSRHGSAARDGTRPDGAARLARG